MPVPPAGEADLGALSERFAQAEARVRALLAKAPAGDRRKLLTEALAILVALRHEDTRMPVIMAYLAAFRAVRRGGVAQDARDLAGSLALKLDRGARTASGAAREAFRTVTRENLEQIAATAVTAHVGKDGTRWPLGAYAEMQTRTIGRRATSRGTRHAVGAGFVEVSSHGTKNPICAELEGQQFPAESAPEPPFHPNCQHVLIPVGVERS